MKTVFVADLLRAQPGDQVDLSGWVSSKRDQGRITFLDVSDSTGKIQVVVSAEHGSNGASEIARDIPVESGIVVKGVVSRTPKGRLEIAAHDITLVGGVTRGFDPHPRSDFDIFAEGMTPHLLANRHIYLRNPKVMTILKYRDSLMHHMRQWFRDNRFTSIDAPILTPVPLYEDGTAMKLTVHDEDVFLTQCVGYYLEAAVHAFERVYNMGPSFRGEEGRSKRHLMEYWHIKAEVAWCDLDCIIKMVEDIICFLTKKCQKELSEELQVLGTTLCTDGMSVPYPRISYEEAVKHLSSLGMQHEFGKSLGSEEETLLSKLFPGRPFWITGIPRTIEPFPYCIDPADTRITRVADLIASNGYGELLGTAEKIHQLRELDERLKDKGKHGDPRFEFVRDVHQLGCVPHAAFGMGVERMIRWMLNIPHVRDAIPFPRIFRRKISP